ncbi:MAG: hypothetical protein CVV44_02435 [Spirochaetae bacterium HGW-Spirochaetae-1]|nr:MAG: hypothetical protein CVV44_02435 [Spirochaetae bacterium HGW-Spirochaetae-1]
MIKLSSYSLFILVAFSLFGCGNVFNGVIDTEYTPDINNFNAVYSRGVTNSYCPLVAADDGGYILGTNDSNGDNSQDIWIAHLSDTGMIEWEYLLGSSEYEELCGVKKLADGGFLLINKTMILEKASPAIWLIRLSAQGTILWEKVFSGYSTDYAADCIENDKGELIVSAYTDSYGSGSVNAVLFKLSGEGEYLWGKVFSSPIDTSTTSACYTYDFAINMVSIQKSYFVTGISLDSSGPEWKSFVVEFDDDGTIINALRLAETGYDIKIGGIIATPNEELILVGDRRNRNDNSKYVYIVAIDKHGSTLWQNSYSFAKATVLRRIIQTSDKNYVVGGYQAGDGIIPDRVFLVKFDVKGNLLTAKGYWDPRVAVIQRMDMTSGGSKISLSMLCNLTQTYDNATSLYVVNLNENLEETAVLRSVMETIPAESRSTTLLNIREAMQINVTEENITFDIIRNNNPVIINSSTNYAQQ